MSSVTITLLNGPPRCGKDTLAALLNRGASHGELVMKFANPLKVAVHASLNLLGPTGRPLRAEAFEDVKDSFDVPGFHGVSPRQAYIQFSEHFAKPLWGKGYFGERLADEIAHLRSGMAFHVIISDSGFAEEARVLVNRFGEDAVRLIQIHRDGCDFSQDSRSYIDIGVEPTIVDNSGSFDDLKRIAQELVR